MARSTLLLALLVTGVLVTSSLAVAALDDDAPLTAAEVEQLAEDLRSDFSGTSSRLITAGAAIFPRLKIHLDDGDSEALLRSVATVLIDDAIDRSLAVEVGVRYLGQFAHLKPLASAAGPLLLALLADEDQPLGRRQRAIGALADIGSPALLAKLEALADDILVEPWVEREVGILMARLGDTTRVDRWLSIQERIAGLTPTSATLPAIIAAEEALGELRYRTGDLDGAIRSFRRRMTLLSDLAERVQPQLARAITQEIDRLQYNMACAHCLAGDIDAAFSALERALAAPDIDWPMVNVDGDLRALRSDPRFDAFRKRLQEARETPAATGEVPGGE